jgi:hypothetical protein
VWRKNLPIPAWVPVQRGNKKPRDKERGIDGRREMWRWGEHPSATLTRLIGACPPIKRASVAEVKLEFSDLLNQGDDTASNPAVADFDESF